MIDKIKIKRKSDGRWSLRLRYPSMKYPSQRGSYKSWDEALDAAFYTLRNMEMERFITNLIETDDYEYASIQANHINRRKNETPRQALAEMCREKGMRIDVEEDEDEDGNVCFYVAEIRPDHPLYVPHTPKS